MIAGNLLLVGIKLGSYLHAGGPAFAQDIHSCNNLVTKLTELGYVISCCGGKPGGGYKIYIYGPGVEVPEINSSKRACAVATVPYEWGTWWTSVERLLPRVISSLLPCFEKLGIDVQVDRSTGAVTCVERATA